MKITLAEKIRALDTIHLLVEALVVDIPLKDCAVKLNSARRVGDGNFYPTWFAILISREKEKITFIVNQMFAVVWWRGGVIRGS